MPNTTQIESTTFVVSQNFWQKRQRKIKNSDRNRLDQTNNLTSNCEFSFSLPLLPLLPLFSLTASASSPPYGHLVSDDTGRVTL
jgi:hypothetical protein